MNRFISFEEFCCKEKEVKVAWGWSGWEKFLVGAFVLGAATASLLISMIQ